MPSSWQKVVYTPPICITILPFILSRAAKRVCFKRGGFPIWTCPSFFVLFCPFGDFPGDFPDLLRDGPGIFPICPFPLSRPIKSTYAERVRDTIWTCPEKSGKHPGLETPRFSVSQYCDTVAEVLGSGVVGTLPITPPPWQPSSPGLPPDPEITEQKQS